MSWKYRLLYLAARLYWLVFRPLTIGVKLMLIKDEAVWLVQHSYQYGWFLPGGGVKKNENLETAVRREAQEELGANLGDVYLFSVYSNITEYKSDHIVVFYCHDFTIGQADKAEIRAMQQFPLQELPPDASHGARRRIAEYLAGRPKAEAGLW